MSVIQTIREKYATLMVVVVCISLVAFLLMDALVGPKSFFHQSTDVGVINGKGLDYREFTREVQNKEDMYRASHPNAPANDDTRQQIREEVWNEFMRDQLLAGEYDKLGIGFSTDELRDLTLTMDADPNIKQIPAFQNPKTGQFEPTRVAAFLQSLKSAPQDNQQAQQQRAQWLQLEEYVHTSSMFRKFSSLIMQAIYVPSWLAKEKAAEKNSFATISYVSSAYTTIPDSSVKVTDAEMQKYLDGHQAMFQQEASRSVEYVSFDAIPTAKDTANIVKQIDLLKAQMDTMASSEIPGFITRNSETKFYDGFIPASMIQSSKKDSLLAVPEGGFFGPYYDNGSLTYARMLDKKTIPDTVQMQQLVISTQAVPDSTAKRRIDSLENAAKKGADFAMLVNEFSDGPKENGGEFKLTPGNPNVPAGFNEFAFNHKKGDVGVVKTEYGYYLIKITDQKDFEPAYKIAYLARHLDPNQETDNAIFSAAGWFAGTNRTRAAFEKASNGQKGVNRQVADNIKPTDYDIQGIGSARDLIQWAYKAKVGDVSEVFSLGNKYVIAVLTGIKEKGTAPLQDIKPQIEALVRRQKKGAVIAAKLKGSSLAEIAKNSSDSVSQAQHIGFTTPFIPDAGFEPKVVGTAFNPQLKGGKLSAPVYGNNGVYVLKVDSIHTETPATADMDQQVKQEEMILQQQIGSQVMEILKKEADIEDHRLKFF